MFSFIKRHKIISAFILVNAIVIAVVVAVIVNHNLKTATIDIYVAPAAATISLNGKDYENFQQYDILPGNYHVKIAMEGMQTKEYDLALEEDGFARIWTYLLDEDGGFEYYAWHPEDELILERVVVDDDTALKDFIAKHNRIYSIGEALPLTFSNTYEQDVNEIVSINISWGDSTDCKKRPYCLVVFDMTGKNHDKALAMITEAGYDPDDYEIVFKQYGDG